ncbi:glycosyltransferase family 39 protein [Chitinophagaceae bacterium LB-8]|uniref:Glycosyltransferase family 39 protein n=1 Tax=Paraflavisolibacter caeni TaxID=2982496 RepID=A0A9X2XX90_9BACT|nr:glycosyltransferase family 39 protein [Paraflavisolibacter caeni]MCU7550976.1 glycosyltransferase family 39 protein [Paraflavisolibacter caeni]
MNTQFLSPAVYRSLFGLAAIVYIIGLFVTMPDNDSAHHASIAMHMYLTGDYVNLIDHGKDYLDKPHLHFWLAALSYHIFGITTFAYKFPSFLFTILGTYSTYRLGKTLYNEEVGKLAALIITTAFAYMLANCDVRMDAILTASIAFTTWQLVAWINKKWMIHAFAVALGLALGFCTKGHIAIVTAGISAFFYILYRRDWKALYHWHLLAIIGFFLLFITPVVYCYYLQFDVHPEKVIRGRSNISGVEFILWQQNFERFQGEKWGGSGKNDYFFFFHSFLWAFAPWSILALIAFFSRLKTFVYKKYEWLTVGTIAVIAVLVSFSGFKLPHYLNIVFPVAAVLTSSYLFYKSPKPTAIKRFAIVQAIICTILLLAAGLLNVWAFPAHQWWVILGFILLAIFSFFLLKMGRNKLQRLVTASAATMIIVFFLLNANFYPQLLKYQGGNELAKVVNAKIGGHNVYAYGGGGISSSFNFYTRTNDQFFHDSLVNSGRKIWVVTDMSGLEELKKSHSIGLVYQHKDFEVTRLKLKFLNPATRQETLKEMVVAEMKR